MKAWVIHGLVALIFLSGLPVAGAAEWNELPGKHFVVYYASSADNATAQTLLRRAEEYYTKIANQIGYTRYNQFWTWDERVKIILFSDRGSYLQSTGQPAWSNGFSDRDSQLFRSKTIVTYKQEQDFFDGLLPHEISHLILHDFVPLRNIPIWFDEGVAQLNEASKSSYAQQMMQVLVSRKQYIPFAILMNWDIRKEKDANKVQIFYAQSLSVVEFLMKHYGGSAFAELCRYLRDGLAFEEALHRAYTNNMNTMADLERKWAASF